MFPARASRPVTAIPAIVPESTSFAFAPRATASSICFEIASASTSSPRSTDFLMSSCIFATASSSSVEWPPAFSEPSANDRPCSVRPAPTVPNAAFTPIASRPAPDTSPANVTPTTSCPAPETSPAAVMPRLEPPQPATMPAAVTPLVEPPQPPTSPASVTPQRSPPAPFTSSAPWTPRMSPPLPLTIPARCTPVIVLPAPFTISAPPIPESSFPAPFRTPATWMPFISFSGALTPRVTNAPRRFSAMFDNRPMPMPLTSPVASPPAAAHSVALTPLIVPRSSSDQLMRMPFQSLLLPRQSPVFAKPIGTCPCQASGFGAGASSAGALASPVCAGGAAGASWPFHAPGRVAEQPQTASTDSSANERICISPLGVPGVFERPCSGARDGDAPRAPEREDFTSANSRAAATAPTTDWSRRG
jgi:hypothetical protein